MQWNNSYKYFIPNGIEYINEYNEVLPCQDLYYLRGPASQKLAAVKIYNPENADEFYFKLIDTKSSSMVANYSGIYSNYFGEIKIEKDSETGKWRINPQFHRFNFRGNKAVPLSGAFNYWEEVDGDFETESGMNFEYVELPGVIYQRI